MVDQVLPRKVWPIIVVAAGLLCELAIVRVGIDDLDEGYFAQQATRVLHGQVPFRDFETLYSPGLVYLHASLFAATGGPSLIAMRAVALAARALLALVLVTLTLPFVRHPLLAALPAIVIIVGIDDAPERWRSEEHTSELQSRFGISHAVF